MTILEEREPMRFVPLNTIQGHWDWRYVTSQDDSRIPLVGKIPFTKEKEVETNLAMDFKQRDTLQSLHHKVFATVSSVVCVVISMDC
jgi:hypothetical protein